MSKQPRIVIHNHYGTRDQQDVFPKAGQTYKQLASALRRSAEADRRGSGMRPLPGRAHGEPTEFSFKEAARQDAMAAWLEAKAISSGQKYVTEADLQEMRAKFSR